MSVEEKILSNDEFLVDAFDTPTEGLEQHRKRECLKVTTNKRKIPS